jgi:hypothetical protein
MRDQYAGDISDYLKFAFLREVAPTGVSLGVAWYYLDGHDGRADGRHEEYLSDPAWRGLDPDLFEKLRRRQGRSVRDLETLDLFDRPVTFHRESVAVASRRHAWLKGLLETLGDCQAVFADPDNGVSTPGVVTRKSATVDEVEQLCAGGRLVFLIRFPHRLSRHDHQLAHYHQTFAPYRPATVRTCVRVTNANGGTSPRIRWFTALNADAAVTTRMRCFASRIAELPGASAALEA